MLVKHRQNQKRKEDSMDWFPSFATGYIVTVVVLKILAYIIVTFCPLIVTIIFTVIMVIAAVVGLILLFWKLTR